MDDHFQRHWTLEVGDPTVGGWLTTILYFLAAFGAVWVYRQVKSEFEPQVNRQRMLWMLFALALLFLGFNKQLDLQNLVIETGRNLAIAQGWYDQRRLVQVGFIKTIAGVSAGLVILFFYLYRKVITIHLLAIFGFCLLAAYIIIRATLFQAPDVLWWHFRWGFKVNWLLECIGLALILANETLLLRRNKRAGPAEAEA